MQYKEVKKQVKTEETQKENKDFFYTARAKQWLFPYNILMSNS